jgi:hypothetical protein
MKGMLTFVAMELAPAGVRSAPKKGMWFTWQTALSGLRRLRHPAGASSLATGELLLKD